MAAKYDPNVVLVAAERKAPGSLVAAMAPKFVVLPHFMAAPNVSYTDFIHGFHTRISYRKRVVDSTFCVEPLRHSSVRIAYFIRQISHLRNPCGRIHPRMSVCHRIFPHPPSSRAFRSCARAPLRSLSACAATRSGAGSRPALSLRPFGLGRGRWAGASRRSRNG